MKKKLIALNTTIMLGLGSVFSIPAVQASSVQSQRSEIQSQIAEAKNIIQDLQAEKAKLTSQVGRIKEAIKENGQKIKNTQKQIIETKADVEALKKDIADLEERIAKRQEILKNRALAFQESGGDVDVIGVLLGSTSFSDFIGRVGAVATIVEADKEILTQQETDKAALVDKKSAVQDKLSKLETMKVELVGMQADIKEQKKQSENTIKTLEVKEAQTTALKTSLEKKDSNLAIQIASIQAANQKVTKRQVAQQDTLNKAVSQVQNSASNDRSSQSTTSAPSSANVSVAISAGYKYIGNSTYVWGGGRTASDVANGYFDCSGFVSWAYRQAGVSLPASTSGLRYAGTQVSTSQMQPGDLVFFNTYKTDGHVGIYVGGGQFIGSQSSTGVAIVSMSSGYWASKFNGRVVRVR